MDDSDEDEVEGSSYVVLRLKRSKRQEARGIGTGSGGSALRYIGTRYSSRHKQRYI